MLGLAAAPEIVIAVPSVIGDLFFWKALSRPP